MVMLPIRKISPERVGLTSYYGKVFVDRSIRKANDEIDWLARQITTIGIDDSKTHISNIGPANVFDNQFKAPRMYSGLSRYFKSFRVGNIYLTFDHKERTRFFPEPEKNVKGLSQGSQAEVFENGNCRIIGKTDQNEFVVMNYDNTIHKVTKDGITEPLGDIYSLCMIDRTQAPIDFSELKIYAKSIPVGIVLGYMLGFKALLTVLKSTPRVVEPRKRIDLKANEWVLAFKDTTLVFARDDYYATLIMAGFSDYKKVIKNYTLNDFNTKDVYLNVLETAGIGARFLREIDLLDQLFIDPVTRDILIEMKEPTTFKGLLLRSVELLLTDFHPDSQDMQSMRIKGYERFSGAVYRELVSSIREFKTRNIRGKSQLDMNPYAVWRNIAQDSSIKLVEDINPIQNLKESEEVTYVGEGGRGKDAMNKQSRTYHENDMGVISEATKDSSDVGVNTYLSANPQFTSLRGLTKAGYNAKVDGVTKLMSTTALVSVGADHDDAKRVNNTAPCDRKVTCKLL